MNPERWQRIADVYDAAMERGPASRAAFLAQACADDPDLRREVESLIAQEHSSVLIDGEMDAIAAAVLHELPRLEAGSELGPYRVEALIGTGGMGEVYRAHDTRLNRGVALKVLPESLTGDPDRLARLTREAHVLASFNHPNIAAIHGLEDRGDVHALVLELVEGATLADVLTRGPIAVGDALPLARQVADAIAAAHERGVVHRDLKPANIKVRGDGTVKVLDFGLAKPVQDDLADAAHALPVGMSPVVSALGVILGTAAYMSPEQAKGQGADKRSDVWAFGCVLYEMLTARRAFDGGNVADTLASVLKEQPDWSRLPADTPPPIRRLLRRAIEKDPKRRLADITDARLEIDEAMTAPAGDESRDTIAPVLTRDQRRVPWTIAAALGAALVGAVMLWHPWRAASAPVAQWLSVELGADAFLGASPKAASEFAISPDGSMLAFVAQRERMRHLYVRRLRALQATPLVTGDVAEPFFSPDGQWIAFFSLTDRTLKKISIAGGSAVVVCPIQTTYPRGGSWGDDGFIVFNAAAEAWAPLLRVPSEGGIPEPVSVLGDGEVAHRWPQVLPGGRSMLFAAFGSVGGGIERANILAQTLPSGPSKIVVRGAHYARYLRSGHLVYVQGSTLFAVPFDLDRLAVHGQPIALIEDVMGFRISGVSFFDVSDSGTLAYVRGQMASHEAPMLWMRRAGTTTPMRAEPRDWRAPRVSPDGTRIAFHVDDGRNIAVYTYEWARDFTTRLKFGPIDSNPVWSPDSRTLVFSSSPNAGQLANLYWRPADASGETHRLTESADRQFATSWHPSGAYLAFEQHVARERWDLMILPITRDAAGWKGGTPERLMSNTSQRPGAIFSPDGRWLAYTSNESGRPEVFIRPFHGPGAPRQVSTSGGWVPAWSRTHDELLYLSLDSRVMTVPYTIEGSTFRPGLSAPWSQEPINDRPGPRPFDVHPDGDRIVVSGDITMKTHADKIVLVSNFFDDVRRRLSAAAR